jgi:hypothetical protein
MAPLSVAAPAASAAAPATAGTGQDRTALVLPSRAGLERVHHASYRGIAEAVRMARHHVAAALAGVPCAEAAAYALSEVATNAVRHSRSGLPGGWFTVAAGVVPGLLAVVAVTDQGGPWKEGGPDFYLHGLGIVREMAAGVQVDGGECGRTVRVAFTWEAAE